MILVLSAVSTVSPNYLLLKSQECEVKKVIVNNDNMTFPYKIKVHKCVGSCNDVENSYDKVGFLILLKILV